MMNYSMTKWNKEELELLEKQGFVINSESEGGWRIAPTIWLDFVADKPEQELRELISA